MFNKIKISHRWSITGLIALGVFSGVIFTNLSGTSQQRDMELMASAYIQAVTNGNLTKKVTLSNGSVIDFSTCNSSLVWANQCQRAVYGGMDGKTIFMYALNANNINILLPTVNAKKAVANNLFLYLANCNYTFESCNYSTDNGWYSQLSGTKTLLRNYLSALHLQFQKANYDQIASAYIQAVTNGAGAKYTFLSDGTFVDFRACNNSTRWGNECQRAVYKGLDGKTIFMNNLNASNLLKYIPTSNAKKAIITDLFLYLANCNGALGFANCDAAQDNGWYASLQSTKTLLRKYLSQLATFDIRIPFPSPGPATPGLYSYFDNIDDSAVTNLKIDIQVNQFPTYYPSDALYFWALQVNFSPVPNDPTEYWGHIGLQMTGSCGAADSKCANWGGGGNGNGTEDYGAGGSKVIKLPWQLGIVYTYSINRKSQVPNSQIWLWEGTIRNKSTGQIFNLGTIKGGEYIVTNGWRNVYGNYPGNNPLVFTETGYGTLCNSPATSVSWSNLQVNNLSFKRVQSYPGGGCSNTVEQLVNGGTGWTHQTNTLRPIGYNPNQIFNLK